MFSPDFEEALHFLLSLEGGLKLHKNPTEKFETYAGIYRGAHPEWPGWSYLDRGETPPYELIEEFYYKNYYQPFEEVEDKRIRGILFETAVNLGVKQTVKLVQKALGLKADGILGPKTLEALNRTDPENFIKDFTLLRIAFYTNLANRNPKRYSLYLRGWINRTFEALKWIS